MTKEQVKAYIVEKAEIDAAIVDAMSNFELFNIYLKHNGVFVNPHSLISVMHALEL